MTQRQDESAQRPTRTPAAGTSHHVVAPCALQVTSTPPYQKGKRPRISYTLIPSASAFQGCMKPKPVEATGTPQSYAACKGMEDWTVISMGMVSWCATRMSNGAKCGLLPETKTHLPARGEHPPSEAQLLNRGTPCNLEDVHPRPRMSGGPPAGDGWSLGGVPTVKMMLDRAETCSGTEVMMPVRITAPIRAPRPRPQPTIQLTTASQRTRGAIRTSQPPERNTQSATSLISTRPD